MEFLGGDTCNSRKMYSLQKHIIRIIAGAQPRTSCISLFQQLQFLPIASRYIFHELNSL